jgi:hypothetical protein
MIFSKSLFSQISETAFEAITENGDIIILNEDMKVSFVGKKAFYINVAVEREIEYQIVTEIANDLINPMILPQPFDEVYRPHSSSIRNERRLFDEVFGVSFLVSIKNAEGEWKELPIEKKIIKNRIVNQEDRFGYIDNYSYSYRKVLPGETIKINYKYIIPFKDNWERLLSTRLFLITKVPRQHYRFSLSHHFDLEAVLSCINVDQPDTDTVENIISYQWEFWHQPGSLGELGAHPQVNLPHVIFSPKPYEFLYEHYNSFQQDFVELWYILSYKKEQQMMSAVDDYVIGSKDRDNLAFQKIAEKYKRMTLDDSIGIVRLRKLQRFIVDSVRYYNDYKFFNNEENYKKDHPGIELSGNVIKEHTKEYIYAGLLPNLGYSFFTAYPSDKRSGFITKEYFAPLLDNESLFAAVLNNNTVAYIMPKSDMRNLYCEELPFYYEESPLMLIYTYDFAGYKRNFSNVLRIVNSPGSSIKDNYRKINSMAHVNIGENKVTFSTKISLSGQYSTLTRSIYKDEPCDSTINPLYLEKIWNIGENQKIENVSIENTAYYFPFKTAVNANYSVSGLIEEKGDSLEIDISNWIKHVIYYEFNAENRFTDFYADFLGSDTWAYMLEFDNPVALPKSCQDIDVENEFGCFKFSVKQISENKILMSSYYNVKSTLVKKENIDKVAEIFNNIEANNSSILKVKVN